MYNNIFKITHNDVLPAQGSILISEPFLQDAYFQRSVVLLVEHTQEGSMGFVLNKKTELSVNTFFCRFTGISGNADLFRRSSQCQPPVLHSFFRRSNHP
ncbi:YqgE/AlgH family protein [Parabacteroides merdae]|nr:YqgE/AlgH family protein [Parabacteroides merdae]MDB9117428.1 YqgE/AlgH family protein [Parabacteroides merdae]